MKTLIAIVILMMVTVSFSINHAHAMKSGQEGQMMGMMNDPDSRSMMMDQIADNPEMRHEMMQKMMHAMRVNGEVDMYQMMDDPEMKAHMLQHKEMMQGMMEPEGMDSEKMKAMMDNPEMKSMMKMHMMCVQMMNGGMTGEQPEENSEEHVH